MEPVTGIGAEPDDIAGVGRNFRLVEDDIEHDEFLQRDVKPRRGASIPSARPDEKDQAMGKRMVMVSPVG